MILNILMILLQQLLPMEDGGFIDDKSNNFRSSYLLKDPKGNSFHLILQKNIFP